MPYTHHLSSRPLLQLCLLFPQLDLPTFPLIFFISVLTFVQFTATLSSVEPFFCAVLVLFLVAVSYLPEIVDIFGLEVFLFLT